MDTTQLTTRKKACMPYNDDRRTVTYLVSELDALLDGETKPETIERIETILSQYEKGNQKCIS